MEEIKEKDLVQYDERSEGEKTLDESFMNNENSEELKNEDEIEEQTENENLSSNTTTQPDWMSKVGDSIKEKLSPPPEQNYVSEMQSLPQPTPPPPEAVQ